MAEKKTTDTKISEENIQREMRRYLKEYSDFRKLLEKENFASDSFGNPTKKTKTCDISEAKNDIDSEIRIKMFEIRRLVTSLPPGDEKVLLFLKYIHGESLESCAEKLGLSPRHIYRLHKNALLLAYRKFQKFKTQKSCIE